MAKVMFSVFSDVHHYPGVFMTDASERLNQIHERAVKNNVDFVIQLGDMCHDPKNCKDFIDAYKNWEMPTYFCLGNHDQDDGSLEDALTAYGMPSNYYCFDCGGFRFVVLDPNYLFDGEKYIHFSHRNYFGHMINDPFRPEVGDIYNCNIPPEEMAWLEDTIMASPYPCVLLSHESLEREYDGIRNIDEFRAVLRRVNKDKKRVFLCINGDTHTDFIRLYEGVYYFSLNSSSMDWIGGEGHGMFPKEQTDRFTDLKYTVLYNEPIHAIVTLEDQEIFIEGMKTDYYLGVDRVRINADRFDKGRRLRTPNVLSEHIIWDDKPLGYYRK